MRWVNVYCLICFAPDYWKTIITHMNVIGKVLNEKPESSNKISMNSKADFSLVRIL